MTETLADGAARTWTTVGRKHTRTKTQRGFVAAAIGKLEWQPVPLVDRVPFAAAYALKAAITEFRIPKVSAIAVDGPVIENRYGIYGIEGNFVNGRARVYLLDRGSDLVPLATDYYAKGATA